MAGARSLEICSISAVDSHRCRRLLGSVDALPVSSFNLRSCLSRRPAATAACLSVLKSPFLGASTGLSARPRKKKQQQQRRRREFVVVDELGGQYEEGFDDVHLQLINYFTYKAMRVVLHQLYEMNPPKYRLLYNFVATNNPKDGKRFLRLLGKESQDLAERVMITRLHLYSKWIKKCDHAKMYQQISDENLELMRERLMETVIWPSDDTNMEKIG